MAPLPIPLQAADDGRRWDGSLCGSFLEKMFNGRFLRLFLIFMFVCLLACMCVCVCVTCACMIPCLVVDIIIIFVLFLFLQYLTFRTQSSAWFLLPVPSTALLLPSPAIHQVNITLLIIIYYFLIKGAAVWFFFPRTFESAILFSMCDLVGKLGFRLVKFPRFHYDNAFWIFQTAPMATGPAWKNRPRPYSRYRHHNRRTVHNYRRKFLKFAADIGNMASYLRSKFHTSKSIYKFLAIFFFKSITNRYGRT